MRIYDCTGSLIHDLLISDPVHVSDWTLWLWARTAELGGGDDAWRTAVAEMHAAVADKIRVGETVVEPLPAPTVLESGEIPRSAQLFIGAAQALGWEVDVRFSRGPLVHASRGTVLRIVDVVGVRCRLVGHDGLPGRLIERAAMVWQDGRAADGWFWYDGSRPTRMGIEALKARMGIGSKTD